MKFKHTYRRAADCVSAPEELTTTVLQIPKQTKPRGISRPLRLVAVAAVLALVIGILSFWPAEEQEYVTGPGLLAIRAYALNENEISEINSTVLEEGVELPWEYAWSSAISRLPIFYGLPIKLVIPEDIYEGMDISLDICVTGGSCNRIPNITMDPYTGEIIAESDYNLGTKFSVPNGYTIYWTCDSPDMKVTARGRSFIDVIIRADNMIVGYAVIEVAEQLPEGVTEPPKGTVYPYLAKVLAIVSFPQVEGEYQSVVRRYVEKKIEEIHQK